MNDPQNVEPGDRELVTLLDEATDLLTPFVVALYENYNGRPRHFGSGFFVRAGTNHFLVSAAHVLETLRSRPLYHYVTPNTTQELSGQLRLNPWHGDRANDPIDIGVLKLADAVVPPFPELNKFAMDISYLRPRLLPRIEKLYAIVGFPASQSKVNPVTRQIAAPAYAYRNRSAPDDHYLAHGISPQTHIVLPLDLKDGVDSDGRHRNFPRPQGMSGSPIWMLLDEQDNVNARVYPVVAVGTKYRKSRRALIGTILRSR